MSDKKHTNKKKASKKHKNGKPRSSKVMTMLDLQPLFKYVAEQKQLHMLRGGSSESFKLSRRDIPFWDALFGKGTQIPTIRMYMSSTEISIVAATAYTTVKNLQLNAFLNYADLQNVFDEYRPVRGEIEYAPTQSILAMSNVATETNCVAAVDYDDASALANVDVGFARDNKKVFHIVGRTGIPKPVKWPVQFDWLPDTEWLTTSTVDTAFATWKPYLISTHNLGTVATGFLYGWCDFQFRASI